MKMELNKYKNIINKTAVYPKTVNDFGKMYTYLGLIGEFREMQDAYAKCIYGYSPAQFENKKQLSKEIGDVIWYITATANEFDLNKKEFDDLFTNINVQNDPYYNNSEEIYQIINSFSFETLAENFKKFYRDGKKIPKELIINKLTEVCDILGQIISDEDFTFDNILEENYNKLIKRRETGTLKGDGDNREEVING